MTTDTALALVATLDRRDVDPDVAAHICRAAIDALKATGIDEDATALHEALIGHLDESDPFVRRAIREEALEKIYLA